jgi:hypothetical protein
MGYSLIDNDERNAVAEFNHLETALTLLEKIRERSPERDLAVAWFDDRPGEIIGTRSFLTVRVGWPAPSRNSTAGGGGHRRIAARSRGGS